MQCNIRSERIGNACLIIRSYGNIYMVGYRHMQIWCMSACVRASLCVCARLCEHIDQVCRTHVTFMVIYLFIVKLGQEDVEKFMVTDAECLSI